MPYRESQPAHSCRRHPVAPAVAICSRCGAGVCLPCVSYAGCAPTCASCARRRQRHAAWRQRAQVAATVVAVGSWFSAGWLAALLR